jgi:hypothetical protein
VIEDLDSGKDIRFREREMKELKGQVLKTRGSQVISPMKIWSPQKTKQLKCWTVSR